MLFKDSQRIKRKKRVVPNYQTERFRWDTLYTVYSAYFSANMECYHTINKYMKSLNKSHLSKANQLGFSIKT